MHKSRAIVALVFSATVLIMIGLTNSFSFNGEIILVISQLDKF